MPVTLSLVQKMAAFQKNRALELETLAKAATLSGSLTQAQIDEFLIIAARSNDAYLRVRNLAVIEQAKSDADERLTNFMSRIEEGL